MHKEITLINGKTIPVIGFGTWQAPNGQVTSDAVKTALTAGYRHVDGAAVYGNETFVGKALTEFVSESGVKREELFVTSKVWNTERGYDRTIAAFHKTLKDLNQEYLDLYLIHWPASVSQFENWEELNAETWRALETLYAEGLVKAIGVSNFYVSHLESLLQHAKVQPMVNQIEIHPGQTQAEVVEFCRRHQIAVEAWSPLGTGRLLQNKDLADIAARYHKSVAQLCIRWSLQNGLIPLPKSVTPERIIQNFDIFDFEISPEDMACINQMPYCGGSGLHPDQIDF